METGETMALASLRGLSSEPDLLSDPEEPCNMRPSPLSGSSLSSPACSAQSSPSFHSVPLTCTSWMVTTVIMNRAAAMGVAAKPGTASAKPFGAMWLLIDSAMRS